MVRADRNPRNLRSVFFGARSPPLARADDDSRGRRRNAGMVHEVDAARGWSRLHVRVSPDPKEKVATTLRANFERRDAEFLSTAAVQPQLRDAPGRLVRPGASGRRFCGDVRHLADTRVRLAEALRRMEGAPKT